MTNLAMALSFVAATASPVDREACMPVEQLKQVLAADYDEELVEAGRINEGLVQLLFVAKDGSTWTLATLMTRGIACVNVTGTHWRWRAKSY